MPVCLFVVFRRMVCTWKACLWRGQDGTEQIRFGNLLDGIELSAALARHCFDEGLTLETLSFQSVLGANSHYRRWWYSSFRLQFPNRRNTTMNFFGNYFVISLNYLFGPPCFHLASLCRCLLCVICFFFCCRSWVNLFQRSSMTLCQWYPLSIIKYNENIIMLKQRSFLSYNLHYKYEDHSNNSMPVKFFSPC